MENKLVVNTNKLVVILDYEKICYFKSDDCYTNIHLEDTTRIVICKSLSRLEKEINSSLFIRIHGSYLVNKHFIKNIDKINKVINMFDGFKIPYTIKLKELLSTL
jgi:two-component system LytT family response regulator